jgi:hypothetical protein
MFVFPAIINGVPKQRRNRCIFHLGSGANLDMSKALAGSFKEMRRVAERGPVIKSEVYIREGVPKVFASRWCETDFADLGRLSAGSGSVRIHA